jgi:uncharacterized membrane protein YkvA (DUF1232 family)
MGPTRLPSRTPWGAILSLIVALLYGASPIDLIPDFLPIVGLLDDAFVVPFMILIAIVQWRYSRRLRAN